MKKTLIFVHIPKTAGTTFARILRLNYFLWRKDRVYWKDYQMTKPIDQMSQKECNKLDVIHGHLSFGIHEYLDKPFHYVTFLRDPVKRVISFYNHILSHPNHYLYEEVAVSGMSISDFIDSGLTQELDNLQVRMLQGDEHAIPYGEVNASHLSLAKDNIERYFPVVGLTEYFDESIYLIRKHLWKLIPYYVISNRNTLNNQDVAIEIKQKIREQNRYDIELYEWAKARLFAQLDDGDQQKMKRSLWKYQKENQIFRSIIRFLPVYKNF